MLNREFVWKDDGIAYTRETGHCERVVEALNMQHAMTVVTPAVKENEHVDGERMLMGADAGA